MARYGYSPATRVFEAAGAAACSITDAWEGIGAFLQPDAEILVAHDGAEVARLLAEVSRERASYIGAAARKRVLSEHTYERRGKLVEAILEETLSSMPGVNVSPEALEMRA
jgi:spore maturation protein CgeB